MTVAKSFALAIQEVSKLHPAAESLIVHALLLSPEPVAQLLRDQGGPARARLLFKHALTIRENVLGPEHPDTAAVQLDLANLGWHDGICCELANRAARKCLCPKGKHPADEASASSNQACPERTCSDAYSANAGRAQHVGGLTCKS